MPKTFDESFELLSPHRLSYPGKYIKFYDEVSSVRQQVNMLKRKGINKFIALGHSGIEVDIEIAKSVPDIDIVIGGHTNTFLYTGWYPDFRGSFSFFTAGPSMCHWSSRPSLWPGNESEF